MSQLKSIALCFAFYLPVLSLVAQTPSVNPRAVLVELFTSEGCSSCPPADDLLRAVAGTWDDSGQRIIALSEHVTYWDHLGWRDSFSSQQFTDRQEAFGRKFSLESVYTPQMVVNGNWQFVGSNRAALRKALAAEANSASGNLHIYEATMDARSLRVSYGFDKPDSKAVDIYAVIVDDSDESGVSRGENAGRTLSHVDVARFIVLLNSESSGRGFEKKETTSTIPAFALESKTGKRHLVLFAQEKSTGRIVVTAMAPL